MSIADFKSRTKKIKKRVTSKFQFLFFIISRWRQYILLRNNIIVVFTMGKVGSSTIYHNLKEMAPYLDIFHLHFLTDEGVADAEIINGESYGRHIADTVKKTIALNPNKIVKVITMVRDPVARDASDFFQNFERDFKEVNIYDESTENLLKSFEDFDSDYTLEWLDKEMKGFFKIDVFERQFDFANKFQIFEKGKNQLLILRLEDAQDVVETALNLFLGVAFSNFSKVNVGESKSYSPVYKEFKNSLKLSPEKIKKIYSSKYAQHFYQKNEIAKFISKWSRSLP